MALHSLYCGDVPLRNCSLTHSLTDRSPAVLILTLPRQSPTSRLALVIVDRRAAASRIIGVYTISKWTPRLIAYQKQYNNIHCSVYTYLFLSTSFLFYINKQYTISWFQPLGLLEPRNSNWVRLKVIKKADEWCKNCVLFSYEVIFRKFAWYVFLFFSNYFSCKKCRSRQLIWLRNCDIVYSNWRHNIYVSYTHTDKFVHNYLNIKQIKIR